MLIRMQALSTVTRVRERSTAVVRRVEIRAAVVDALRIVRVDADQAAIRRPHIHRIHALPRVAAIGAAEDPAFHALRGRGAAAALAAAARRIRLDDRVDDSAVATIDVEPDASQRSRGQALGQLLPGAATVVGAVHRAARSTAVVAPGGALTLIHRGDERLWILRVHDDLAGAGMVVDVEDLRPRLAAVGRLVDAALRVRTPQMPDRGDVHDIRVRRIDDDAPDV